MTYAVAETRLNAREIIVNLSGKEVDYHGILVKPHLGEAYTPLMDCLNKDDSKHTLSEPATSMLMNFCKRVNVVHVFVDRDVFSAVNTNRKANYVFRESLRSVACDDFKDSFGNYI